MKPFLGIIVTLPEGFTISSGERFIKTKIDWIIEHNRKIKEFEKTYTIFDEHSNFAIRNHLLSVKRVEKSNVKISVKDGIIKAEIPISKEIRNLEIQKKIRFGITIAMRKEAKHYLPKRVEELSNLFGLHYNELFIKNIKSRWGSCSSKNNINLSIHLMMLPDHLIDYVILHELAHTKIKNHSKEYWLFLNKFIVNAKTVDKQLRFYKIDHY